MSQDKDKIYLNNREFEKVLSKEIGHGTDGVVFRYNRNYLIKLYRKDFFQYPEELLKGDKEDTDLKTFDPENKPTFVPMKSNIQFYIKEGDTKLKLADEVAIKKTIEKQKKIVKTRLPQKLVYVDGKFVGVLLKTVHGIQIHKFSGSSMAYKKKIMHAVLDAVKELLDNYVYHIDLDNSPYARTSYQKGSKIVDSYGHSHVLLNPLTLKVNLIDLEGKSTIYSDHFDEELEKDSLLSLTRLMNEFLFNIDPYEHEDTFYGTDKGIEFELEKHGLSPEEANKLANEGLSSIEEAYDIVNKAR